LELACCRAPDIDRLRGDNLAPAVALGEFDGFDDGSIDLFKVGNITNVGPIVAFALCINGIEYKAENRPADNGAYKQRARPKQRANEGPPADPCQVFR
jgi:hypothetical protein